MPGHRIGANKDEESIYSENRSEWDKDWRALSWRDHLVLKNGDGVERYESRSEAISMINSGAATRDG